MFINTNQDTTLDKDLVLSDIGRNNVMVSCQRSFEPFIKEKKYQDFRSMIVCPNEQRGKQSSISHVQLSMVLTIRFPIYLTKHFPIL